MRRDISTITTRGLMIRLISILTAVIMTVLCLGTTTAYAAGIAQISIKIGKVDDLELPDITSNSSKYEVTNVEWQNVSNIKIGDIVTGIVTVKPTEGNNLYVSSLSNVKTTGEDVDLISIEGWDTEMKITLHFTVKGELSAPKKAYWSKWIAKCSEVDNAEQYEFVLYADGREVYRDKSSTNSLDLSRQLANVYYYDDVYFKVRALNDGNTSSSYTKSSDFNNWSKLKDYCEDEGIVLNHSQMPNKPSGNSGAVYLPPMSSTSNGWIQSSNGSWSYLVNGKKTTGWQNVSGTWYYMNSSGIMLTGWQYINGTWYYLNSDGSMATGWIFSNGKWYWCESSGNMISNTWRLVNNYYYYFNASGEAVKGWQYINGSYYYFNEVTTTYAPECALVQ